MLKQTNKEEEGFMTDDQMEDQCHGLLFNAYHADGSGGPQCWKDLSAFESLSSWEGMSLSCPLKWTANE